MRRGDEQTGDIWTVAWSSEASCGGPLWEKRLICHHSDLPTDDHVFIARRQFRNDAAELVDSMRGAAPLCARRSCCCSRAPAVAQHRGSLFRIMDILTFSVLMKRLLGPSDRRGCAVVVDFMWYFTADLHSLPYKERQSCLSAIGRAPQPAGSLHFNPFTAEFYLVQPYETMQGGCYGQINVLIFETLHRSLSVSIILGCMEAWWIIATGR